MLTQRERGVLRGIAGRLAEIARLPIQQERMDGWKKINGLQRGRPMVWITEIPWGEFEGCVDELRLVCTDAEWQWVERSLRQRLFTAERLPCDQVEDGVFWISNGYRGVDYGVEVREKQIEQGRSSIRSHAYETVIGDMDDIAKIKMPKVTVDREWSESQRDRLASVFGDLMPVRQVGTRCLFFPAWDDVVRWMGVDRALMDMVDRPEFVHAVMRRVTDSFLSAMTQLEEQGLLGYPHPMSRIGSGGAGFTDELPREDYRPDRIRCIDLWGGATAQIFGSVSPEMHEEFALRYEVEVMQRCGLNYYGCCEPLHDRMAMLAAIPRLRKVSISAWCDVAKAAESAKARYVFSHKPSPAVLASDRFDTEAAERDLRDRLDRSQGMPCEFIMKDISTVRGDMTRIVDWCRIAARVAGTYHR